MSKNFSAEDVAKAIDALVKAGLTADQIIGGALSGALQIATCGDIPAWQASEYAAAAINCAGLNAACLNAAVSVQGGKSVGEAARMAMNDRNWEIGRGL